jgi:hypothetical protein
MAAWKLSKMRFMMELSSEMETATLPSRQPEPEVSTSTSTSLILQVPFGGNAAVVMGVEFARRRWKNRKDSTGSRNILVEFGRKTLEEISYRWQEKYLSSSASLNLRYLGI